MMKHRGSKLKLSRLLPNAGSTFSDIKMWYTLCEIGMRVHMILFWQSRMCSTAGQFFYLGDEI